MIDGIAYNLVIIRARQENHREEDQTAGQVRSKMTTLQFAVGHQTERVEGSGSGETGSASVSNSYTLE